MNKIKSKFLILLTYLLNPEDAMLVIIEKLLMMTDEKDKDV